MAKLPDYIPEAVAEELQADYADFPELLERLDDLLQRPLMPAICRTLADTLTSPRAWFDFLFYALKAANTAELYWAEIKPARKAFEDRRATAMRAGLELRAALAELADSAHGYEVPPELRFLWYLLDRAAIRKGHSETAAYELAAPLLAEFESSLATLMQGNGGPEPLEFADLLASLADGLENWRPAPDGQGQGTARGTVFVRALDSDLARQGMDAKALLTDAQMADLTRAALGMSDKFNEKGNRFDAADVRSARKYNKKTD